MHHDFFNLTRLNNSKATLDGMESIFAKEVMNTLQVTLIHLSSTIGRLVSRIVCKDRSNELTYFVSGKYFPVATDANSPHQYNSRESDKAQGLILP
eukprot:scaffold2189_cov204-Alexandrium_tamarense.AAC.2